MLCARVAGLGLAKVAEAPAEDVDGWTAESFDAGSATLGIRMGARSQRPGLAKASAGEPSQPPPRIETLAALSDLSLSSAGRPRWR